MKKLSSYINENALQKIGCGFNDILIERDKFIPFTETVYQYGYVVTDITWWKHKTVGDTSDDCESMGGMVDFHNKAFYWAETIYCQYFDKDNTQQAIMNYYDDCCNNDKYHNLIPSLSIEKAQG